MTEIIVTLLAQIGIFFCLVGVPMPLLGFFLVIGATNFYYAIAGPTYWQVAHKGYFLGVDWSDQLWPSSMLLSLSVFCLVLLTRVMYAVTKKAPLLAPRRLIVGRRIWSAVTLIGVVAGAYSLVSALVTGNTHQSGNPFFLIAYQFSDLLIPALLFAFARDQDRARRHIYVVSFLFFALAIGFRYKLALFFGAILVYVFLTRASLMHTNAAKFLLLTRSAIVGMAAIMSLAFLTLIRRPFAGADLTDVHLFSRDDYLYGLFAEANTIFGLSAIIDRLVPNERFYYLQPVVDAFAELVPRFLYPSRVTGAYLGDVLAGLISAEAAESGTAYPFVGELLLMWGYPSLMLGLFLLAGIIVACIRMVDRAPVLPPVKLMGYAIIAIYFGYYFYSRGYFAQSLKGFLFVVAPFLLMTQNFRWRNKKLKG